MYGIYTKTIVLSNNKGRHLCRYYEYEERLNLYSNRIAPPFFQKYASTVASEKCSFKTLP